MKKRFSLIFASLFLASCTSGVSSLDKVSSSDAPESSKAEESSSSKKEESSIKKALDALKIGFHSKVSFKVTEYNSNTDTTSIAIGREVILKAAGGYSVYGARQLSFNARGELKDSTEPFSYYYSDDEGTMYQENLTYDNKVIADYRITQDNYFESIFYNPFELLDEEDFYYIDKGNYYISEGPARQIASWFVSDINNYTNRKMQDNCYFVLNNGRFESFHMNFEDKTGFNKEYKEILSLSIRFEDTGNDVSFQHTSPLNDSLDRTSLINAFENLSGKSYTLDYVLTPDSMGLERPIHQTYYYDGDNIYIDNIEEGSVKGFDYGDLLLKKQTDGTMQGYSYGSSLKFEKDTTILSGLEKEEYLPKFKDISPYFFTPKGNDTYTVKNQYLLSVYCELQPLLMNCSRSSNPNIIEDEIITDKTEKLYYSENAFAASSIEVTIKDNVPTINLKYINDAMGFANEELITITFDNIGSTKLPSEVTAKLPE